MSGRRRYSSAWDVVWPVYPFTVSDYMTSVLLAQQKSLKAVGKVFQPSYKVTSSKLLAGKKKLHQQLMDDTCAMMMDQPGIRIHFHSFSSESRKPSYTITLLNTFITWAAKSMTAVLYVWQGANCRHIARTDHMFVVSYLVTLSLLFIRAAYIGLSSAYNHFLVERGKFTLLPTSEPAYQLSNNAVYTIFYKD